MTTSFHYIQFSTLVWATGKAEQPVVQAYTEESFEKAFTPQERIWLNEGKIVERDNERTREMFVD